VRWTLRQIAFKIGVAIIAGVVVGALDLWVYEFSVRGFLAGLAAGVAYYLIVVFFYLPGMRQYPLFVTGFAIVAGSIGATAWWLVCRGAPLWMAISIGSVLALAHFVSEGLLSGRR
jgi:hypothetical protein